jgi:DNA-directed RNA polymerase
MQALTGMEYIMIDIANQYGLDKESWARRISWFKSNKHTLDQLASKADKPVLYRKAVRAYRDAKKGIPIGFIMGLDK